MPSSADLDDLRTRLAPFIEKNAYSRVDKIERPKKGLVVFSPWGDDSLIIHLDKATDDFFDFLNGAILPERFSAIYHTGSRKLEFLYTPYSLSSELAGRTFDFLYKGKTHKCSFALCSDGVLQLARYSRPTRKASNSQYRNIPLIQQYVWKNDGVEGFDKSPLVHPSSFWIENIDWNDENIVELARVMNFYATYFDTKAPVILIHTPRDQNFLSQPQTQFRHGKFPQKVLAKPLDSELYHFWAAGRTTDPARRFVYNYQVLEYLAFYMIDDEMRSRLKKRLSAPHALDDIAGIIDELLEVSLDSKIHDGQKIMMLLKKTVDPELIWREIKRNIDFFERPTEFEGGYSTISIAKKDWSAKDFEKTWPTTFANTIRDIRNALSHAKEQRMSNVIAPTNANLVKLQNWGTLISIAASEAVVYSAE
jgi:hypothetical protein